MKLTRQEKILIREDIKKMKHLIRPIKKAESPINEGYCPESGCVKKDGNFWRVISNITGKLWPQKYDTKEDADGAIEAYHANKG
jgi:hypothetical protein